MKTEEQRWTELLDVLVVSAMGNQPDKYGIARITPKLGALHLIQPFDWMAWKEPYPSAEQAKLMNIQTAVKHITRYCRAERFMEGALWSVMHNFEDEGARR
jgi:hypothetical protein